MKAKRTVKSVLGECGLLHFVMSHKIQFLVGLINFGIFVGWLSIWLIPSFIAYHSDSGKCAGSELRPYVRKKPITVLVHKEFPERAMFVIGVDRAPILFTYDFEDGKINARIDAIKNSISVVVTNLNDPVIGQIGIMNNESYYLDENGDGVFEKKIPRVRGGESAIDEQVIRGDSTERQ